MVGRKSPYSLYDNRISSFEDEHLEHGDSLMACSDGLWHYFTPAELGTVLHSLPPRDGAELLVNKARQRAKGTGDNLSLAIVRLDPLE